MGRNRPSDKKDAAGLLQEIAAQLPENGFDDRRRDARLLLAMALGRDDAVLPHEDVVFTDQHRETLSDLIDRRQDGEPISRMRGWREFYSLNFQINHATLDPRPDSEVLVEAVIAWLNQTDCPQPHLLDLGTGSGCLLLSSLYHHPGAMGLGVDIQPDAVAMAEKNASLLGLSERARFKTSAWDDGLLADDGLAGQFDVIISNPPYIPKAEILTLMDEVKTHDPMVALDGGEDGFDAWRQLAPVLARRLRPSGAAFVEIGAGQDDDLAVIFGTEGLSLVAKYPDLSGINRCLEFRLT